MIWKSHEGMSVVLRTVPSYLRQEHHAFEALCLEYRHNGLNDSVVLATQ
jgi:hypothetical protein